MKPQWCEHVRAVFYGLCNRLPLVTNRLFSSGLHLRDDCKAVICGGSWKDWTITALLKFEISLNGDRHRSGSRPIRSRCRGGRSALSSRRQLRNLDFVGFVTANCVQHYEEGLKPEAVAKLHFSESEIAAYCVCSTKLLVGEMDERDLKTLEAGKVGNVLMTLAPALKRIRYGCARKVWDARRKQ